MAYAEIVGIGHYDPKHIITNSDLSKIVDTDDEWIQKRIGITERKFYNPLRKDFSAERLDPLDVGPYAMMGALAVEKALKSANLCLEDVVMVAATCMGQDRVLPHAAADICRILGQRYAEKNNLPSFNVAAANFDIKAACSGSVYGIALLDSMISNPFLDMGKNEGEDELYVLVSTEANSLVMDYTDRGTCCIFGDGAAALIFKKSKNPCVIASYMSGITSDSVQGDSSSRGLWTTFDPSDGREKIGMNGAATFKEASKSMIDAVKVVKDMIERENDPYSFFDPQYRQLLVPHQANLRIMNTVAKSLGYNPSDVLNIIANDGNTISASIPRALSMAYSSNALKPGDRIMTTAYGGGRTYGSNAIIWTMPPPRE